MAKGYGMSTNPLADGGVESLRLKVGDDEAHYLKAGSGRPVVLLHGGATDSRDWLETMRPLSGSHTFFAPDLVGYGLSDKTKDGYRLSDFVEYTVRFTEALDLSCPVLVGHSLGGRVCLEIALRRPERVHKLVLINNAGFSKLGRLGSFIGFVAWKVRTILGRPQPSPKFLKEDGAYADWVCLEELPSLRVPTLIVWSRRDLYYPLAGAIRAADLIPKARLEVLPCEGHAPHRQKRGCFNKLLLDFLNHDQDSEV